jgi:hypothetical protein
MGARLAQVFCLAAVSVLAVATSLGQQAPQPLITQPIIESQLVTLKGNTHPLAQPRFDIGAAPPNLSMQRMLLVLNRDPQRDFALHKLLDDQQDKASPNYHRWLTPDEFGIQFGPSDQDVQLVTGWLQTHGFQVNRVSHGRTVIEFSGMEAQVEQAFHTQVHQYSVNGQLHWANASDPQIPAALAPAVAGIWSLHDFKKKAASRLLPTQVPVSLATNTSNGHHFLMPGDYGIIYGINSLYSAGINGQNASIAVVARSGLNWYDAYSFHNIAGIPTNITFINDGPDPGIFDQGEEAEAVLDATWASALAYNAQTKVVISASTDTTDGVDLSELYIVDNNIADVMTESFGACESFYTSSEAAGISLLAQQTAAQGITYMVSSGDSGAEGCDNPNANSASHPISPNLLASTPYNVSVGGTIFNENGNTTKYWSSTNSSTLTSAKTYIPENVWNESCSTCGLWSGGGGGSTFFSKPNWQFGVQGIPSDGVRDQPDVSLSAAGHDAYLICFEGSCSRGGLAGIAGTSAAAPSFAGIMALVVQQYGRQGQANYTLYRLAAGENLSQCNASNTTTPPASTCIFNDVTKGNNAVPGEAGYGTSSAKYQAGIGYDLATGLGSVNAANLVNKWNMVTFNATTTTLAPNSINGTHGSPVTLNVSVAASGSSGTPTGDVSFKDLSNSSSLTCFYIFNSNCSGFATLANGIVSTQLNNLPGGSYSLIAHYGGDQIFAPSDSAAIQVNITPENSSTTLSVIDQNRNPFTGGPYGSFVYVRADVRGNSGNGIPTGSVWFFDSVSYPCATPLYLNSQGNTALLNGCNTLGVGPHSLNGFYVGDNSFNKSTSAAVAFTITPASTTTVVMASPSGVASGSNVSLQANVSASGFGQSPGGSVNFFSGNTQIGSSPVFANSTTPGGVMSTTMLNISTLPTGQNNITAQYTGDGNYTASSASPVTVTVDADFSISAGNPSIAVTKPGSSGSNTLTITGQTGYANTINFSSASCTGLPLLSTCTFSPPSVNGSGNSTVTITTTAPSAALHGLGWTSTGFLFAAVFLAGIPSRRRYFRGSVFLVLLSIALGNVACGGGSGGVGGGTPPGSYTVVVTATTSDKVVSHTASFTVLVQ